VGGGPENHSSKEGVRKEISVGRDQRVSGRVSKEPGKRGGGRRVKRGEFTGGEEGDNKPNMKLVLRGKETREKKDPWEIGWRPKKGGGGCEEKKSEAGGRGHTGVS